MALIPRIARRQTCPDMLSTPSITPDRPLTALATVGQADDRHRNCHNPTLCPRLVLEILIQDKLFVLSQSLQNWDKVFVRGGVWVWKVWKVCCAVLCDAAVLCGVVWCGVVWCGVVWRGVVWCCVVG